METGTRAEVELLAEARRGSREAAWAFRALGRFDGRRPFGAWLHRTVVNRALNLLRDERWLVGMDRLPEEGADDPEAGGDPALLARVAGLPPGLRAVVILRYGGSTSVPGHRDAGWCRTTPSMSRVPRVRLT
jgi:hypothetical protein